MICVVVLCVVVVFIEVCFLIVVYCLFFVVFCLLRGDRGVLIGDDCCCLLSVTVDSGLSLLI